MKDEVLLAKYSHLLSADGQTWITATDIRPFARQPMSESAISKALTLMEDDEWVEPNTYEEVEYHTLTELGIERIEGFIASEGIAIETFAGIPASDRVVRLDDNTIAEVDAPLSQLLRELERDNGSPDQPGLRERLLGQIRAGKEMINSGQVRLFSLYVTLSDALHELINKYGNAALVALANALLGVLASKIFGAS